MEKAKFDVRQVDSLCDIEFDFLSWYWNASYYLFSFETSAKNEKRAFTQALKKHGITFKKNRTRITFDGDVYEITDRKTGEILFAAIPA